MNGIVVVVVEVVVVVSAAATSSESPVSEGSASAVVVSSTVSSGAGLSGLSVVGSSVSTTDASGWSPSISTVSLPSVETRSVMPSPADFSSIQTVARAATINTAATTGQTTSRRERFRVRTGSGSGGSGERMGMERGRRAAAAAGAAVGVTTGVVGTSSTCDTMVASPRRTACSDATHWEASRGRSLGSIARLRARKSSRPAGMSLR